MNIRPLKDRLVVKRLPSPEKSGSIVIPDVAKEKLTMGTVISIGPKVDDVKVGDTVYFGRMVDLEQYDFVMIQEADIRVVVDNA
jgi:chaperonin GroES